MDQALIKKGQSTLSPQINLNLNQSGDVDERQRGCLLICWMFSSSVVRKFWLPSHHLSHQVYYYAEAQTTHTTFPNGMEILQFPNHQTGKTHWYHRPHWCLLLVQISTSVGKEKLLCQGFSTRV